MACPLLDRRAMTDTEALSDPWFIQTEPFEAISLPFELEISLRPRLAPAILMIAFVVIAPLAFAAFAML